MVITNSDGYNDFPYLFYGNSSALDTPCEDMAVISFEGEIMNDQTDDIENIRKWIANNKDILLQFWKDEISSFDFIDNMKKI